MHLRKNHGKTGPGRKKADAARLISQVQYKMALPGRMSLDHCPQITMRRGRGISKGGRGVSLPPIIIIYYTGPLGSLVNAHWNALQRGTSEGILL